jgi:hemoglobin
LRERRVRKNAAVMIRKKAVAVVRGWRRSAGRVEYTPGRPRLPSCDMSENANRKPTLYEWAGGHEAIERLINVFYDLVDRDELLATFFPGGVSQEHRRHVVAWWSEVFGGPDLYSRELGGYEQMLGKHRGLGINPEQRRRFVSLMSIAADEAELPGDPEFRSALLAYLEWGSRLAMHNSQPGADVVKKAPVPRWGWGEAPPFED